jgi:ectoine hydroxylase-related dioxygenase (phytanoyl-CoA dioxygenase family)
MRLSDEWHSLIAAEARLPPDAARQLREIGFTVMPGPAIPGGGEGLSDAYDRAVAMADPTDVHVGRTRSSTRINDFVNRGSEFDGIYIHPPLLAACRQIVGGPFKLSGMRARTLNPGALTERLHVDVKHRADGWPLVGCILMVDAFDAENGATRFVPGSHRSAQEPSDVMSNPQDAHDEQVLACGPAGSIIIFNASVWHSHGANRSYRPRRSIQAHFCRREARAAPDDHSRRMRPETLQRISDLAKYVLNV